MLAGTTLVPDGEKFELAYHEQGVRYMALTSRYHRRSFGKGIREAMEKGRSSHRFTRAFLPGPSEKVRDTGFFS
jgi:hypothetical protein